MQLTKQWPQYVSNCKLYSNFGCSLYILCTFFTCTTTKNPPQSHLNYFKTIYFWVKLYILLHLTVLKGFQRSAKMLNDTPIHTPLHFGCNRVISVLIWCCTSKREGGEVKVEQPPHTIHSFNSPVNIHRPASLALALHD